MAQPVSVKNLKPGFYWASTKGDIGIAKIIKCELILKVYGEAPFYKYLLWEHERNMLLAHTELKELNLILPFEDGNHRPDMVYHGAY